MLVAKKLNRRGAFAFFPQTVPSNKGFFFIPFPIATRIAFFPTHRRPHLSHPPALR
jgi:hypothetical protein